MGAVGAFPGLGNQRRTQKAPVNPMDKSTVISIFPRPIDEVKHTIEPGYFHIDAGSLSKPSTLVVGPSSWWKELEDDQPLLEIPISSISIANSIVDDWANGLLACNMGDLRPGVFFLPGELTVTDVLTKFKQKLEIYNNYQRNWYMALVRMGDNLWARSNGNPLSISDDMRLAATELNLQDKEWMKDVKAVQLTRCIACGALRNPEFPICGTCKAVADPELAKKLNLTFAM